MAPLVGVKPEQLSKSMDVNETPTGISKFKFSQTYEGYEVYGSHLLFMGGTENGTISSIASSFFDLTGEVGSVQVERDDALSGTQNSLERPGLEPKRQSAVVFPKANAPELAWVFVTPRQEVRVDPVEIVVSAQTGEVLKTTPLYVKD